MSYRARLNVMDCDARMRAIDVGKARRLLEKSDVGVDSCFLDAMKPAADGALDEGLPSGMVEIPKDRCWFSGNHVNAEGIGLLAPMIAGKLSGYFVGEDGSFYDGFVIENGRLEKRVVKVTLASQEGPGATTRPTARREAGPRSIRLGSI